MKRTILFVILFFLFLGGLVGIYYQNNATEKESLNTSQSSSSDGIHSIDDVYDSEISKGYVDIRDLSEDYTVEQAIQDRCFVIGAMVHNDDLYSAFMDDYEKQKSSFIRVVQTTVEGDLFIIDLFYDATNNQVHLVKDDTRDEYSAQEDRTIQYRTYEKVGVWNVSASNSENSEYWVVYNGELPSEYSSEIDSDEFFLVAVIN